MSQIDAAGNARPANPERRYMGQFQNRAQRIATQGYQDFGRRADRRGAFAQPWSPYQQLYTHSFRRFIIPGGGTMNAVVSPYGTGPLSYGAGFIGSAPLPSYGASDLDAILARRYDLLEESTLGAPVARIVESQRQAAGLPPSPQNVPFRMLVNSVPSFESVAGVDALGNPVIDEAAAPAPDALRAPSAPTLGTRLLDTMRPDADAAYASGWADFAAGRYHRAIRWFERSSLLTQGAIEPQLGVVFSQLANGSIRSAVRSATLLADRSEELFAAKLGLREHFADPGLINSLRLELELAVRQQPEAAALKALQALLLWHVGEERQAILVAESLGEEHGDSPFAGWLPVMLEAREATTPPAQP